MRIVRTTRGEVCEQVGRVQDGQLGELGIDGVFHDDGRFHPMSADVLPETSRVGTRVVDDDATASVSCQLAGQVIVGEHLGVDRSAGAADGHERAIPRSDLRDISFGILGPDAVSVSYREGAADRTDAVLAPIGAYLIVQRTAPHQQLGIRVRKPRHRRRPASLRTAHRDHLSTRREALPARTRPAPRRPQ